MKIVIIEENELRALIEDACGKAIQKHLKAALKGPGEKVFYINQVAKMLGKSHTTIKKACISGLIRTTPDGQISESAIEEYLNK